MWTKVFQCEGSESVLLDCGSSGSARNTCSPGKAVGLTCSEADDVRLVGGASRCAGGLEMKQHGDWRPVDDWNSHWNLKSAAVVCRQLDCGSAVSAEKREDSSLRSLWRINPSCLQSGSTLRECVLTESVSSYLSLQITCSESVRLVDGTSLCSGRLEVKSNQFWSSVCEADFDQQDAEVVCRELGCGAPSVLQGALYGEVEAPMWTKVFQCEGSESVLLDCGSSGSARNTCSPGKAVGLTCSADDVRLVGGASHCAGGLEMKQHGDWRPVYDKYWSLKSAAVVCRQLDCGSAVSTEMREDSSSRSVWRIRSSCLQSGSTLKECVLTTSLPSSSSLQITCSESVRLVNGTSLCSGRLEVKSNQFWSSVCEADFDQQDADVVCRELGCGAPSVLQGALYGEVEAPMWTKVFQCEGSESVLLDCGSSGSARNTCSPGKAVGLTCSEPDDVRLVGGASRCAGGLEMKQHGDWRPVDDMNWKLKSAAVVCRQLDCGSAVSAEKREDSSLRSVWRINPPCLQSGSTLRECVLTESVSSYLSLQITCSEPDDVRLVGGASRCAGGLEMKQHGDWKPVDDKYWNLKSAAVVYLLIQPIISLSPSMDGVSEAQQQGLQVFRGSSFTISCSIQPQYPGGSFHLTSTASNTAHDHIQPAVNHSAHFLFPAAAHAHQGNYSCVYHIYVFSHNFSSESQPLSLTVSDLIIRLVVLLLIVVLITVICCYFKATRGQKPGREENIELDYYNLGSSSAEGGPGEEAGAQGTE
ncbi:scavenger receptor cysteine-rich type 1 protein M130-like [Centroberyx affinis]|uniref:scavenger receptor cysteine-rich type 1 protein M130-like n=1 Tax=Centroberyx affinis TaxID=166261 RepID=UPI003A5C6678